MSACCKPWVQLFVDAGNGWPHSALRYISACQLAATSEIVKALRSIFLPFTWLARRQINFSASHQKLLVMATAFS